MWLLSPNLPSLVLRTGTNLLLLHRYSYSIFSAFEIHIVEVEDSSNSEQGRRFVDVGTDAKENQEKKLEIRVYDTSRYF